MNLCGVKVTGLALALLLLIPQAVHAHAFLDHAEPRVGSQVSQSPAEVKIWFTEKLEPAFSVIEVRDAAGKQVDKRDSHLDAKDKALLIISLPPLGPGTYKVIWQVVSTDTHRTKGSFKFTVKP